MRNIRGFCGNRFNKQLSIKIDFVNVILSLLPDNLQLSIVGFL